MARESRPVRAPLNTIGARFPTQAKKRLIATHANSKIRVAHSQQTTSHFLIATRNSFSLFQILSVPLCLSGKAHARIGFRS
jgi:hypothetical protein